MWQTRERNSFVSHHVMCMVLPLSIYVKARRVMHKRGGLSYQRATPPATQTCRTVRMIYLM